MTGRWVDWSVGLGCGAGMVTMAVLVAWKMWNMPRNPVSEEDFPAADDESEEDGA